MGHLTKIVTEQHALAQKTLIDFLQADLDLCFTMLHTATIASDPAHTRSAIGRAREGLQVIRKLAGRIENPQSWTAVNGRADELERALQSFPDRPQPQSQSATT